MKKIFAFTLLSAAIAFTSCGKDDDPVPPVDPVISVEKVELNKTTLSLDEGGTETLTVTVTPAGAENKAVTWSTSDAAIATVSDAGVVTAVKKGTATITATSVADKTKTAACEVTVAEKIRTDAFQNEGEVNGESWEQAYEIASAEQFKILAKRINEEEATWNGKYYKLIADIDFGADNMEEWIPVGNGKSFTGHFDGGDHELTGKFIYRGGNCAVFGAIKTGAEIKNLYFAGTVDATEAKEYNFLAGIVAFSSGGVVMNCHNSADLNGTDQASGIVGRNMGDTKIIACTNSGMITSQKEAYGIVDNYSDGLVMACVNKGSVTSLEGYAGGISSGDLVGCINKGPSIIGDYYAAGIAATGVPVACWSAATTIQAKNPGAIVGMLMDPSSACYWKEISGVKGVGFTFAATTDFASFTGDHPTADQIAKMNAAWKEAQPDSEYRFNAETGEIEAIAE